MKNLLVTTLLVLSAVCAYAQPQISYIIPDIGTTRFATYVEFVGPASAIGNFGKDTTYLNNPGDVVRVRCERASDTMLLKVGPIVVSWDGRLISTHIFVDPLVQPPTHDIRLVPAQFRIPLVVEFNGDISRADTFFIVKPQPFGDKSTDPGRVIGEGNLGLRSRRGAMIIDSMVLAGDGARYTVSSRDCDPDNAAGNQGYLPFTLISLGNVRSLNNGIATTLSLSANGATAGPGGGGGGGGYKNVALGGSGGSQGGDGFTGGGPGGVNIALGGGSRQKPGDGTGELVAAQNANTRGGRSLNGVQGGESTTAYENAGGGTGHPFGVSGDGCSDKNICNPEGGYGAGSGGKEGDDGGAGGYATAGNNGKPARTRDGKIYGNPMLVPLAGGSGGASGNPDLLRESAAGGGGGGAMSLHALRVSALDIEAKGASSARLTVKGGSGSGGGLIVGMRNDNAGMGILTLQTNGGDDAGAGANGGDGRVRIDARSNTGRYIGILTDTLTNSLRQVTISGYSNGNDVQIFLKGEHDNWVKGPLITGYTDKFSATFNLPGTDTLYYVAAGVTVPTIVTTTTTREPQYVFSQSAWNIIRVFGPPIISAPQNVNIGLYQCEGQVLRDTITVKNNGESPLVISSATFGGAAGFTLSEPTVFPDSIQPFDSTQYIVEYQPVATVSGAQNATLTMVTNDTAAARTPFVISLTTNVQLIKLQYSWRGLPPSDTVVIGPICVGVPYGSEAITIKNLGTSSASLLRYISGDAGALEVSGNLPFTLAPSLAHQLTPIILTRKLGVQVTPTLLFVGECPVPDTLWIKYEGVEAKMTVVGSTQFGVVRVGDTPRLRIELRNDGTSDLPINTLPPVSAPFRMVSVLPAVPVILKPAESLVIEYAYEPTAAGTNDQLVEIGSRNTTNTGSGGGSFLRGCADTVLFILSGRAVESTVMAVPASVNFGQVPSCDSLIDTIRVVNTGQVDVIVNYPGTINGTHANVFTIIAQPSADTTLAPGDTAYYEILYQSAAAPDGVKQAQFSVRTNHPTASTITVPLNAERVSSTLQGSQIIDIGVIPIGTTITATRFYKNIGTALSRVVAVRESDPVRTKGALSVTSIPAGDSTELTVSTTIIFEGNIEDTLWLVTDTPCSDSLAVIVRGSGAIPEISGPTIVSFGTLVECETKRDSIVYANTSSVPITLIDIVLDGADKGLFTLENPQDILNRTLQPEERVKVFVVFNPVNTTDGSKNAEVRLRVRLGNAPTSLITKLVGERTTALTTAPTQVLFGLTDLNTTTTSRVTILNSSPRQIHITNIALRAGGLGVFTIVPGQQLPITLDPSQSTEVMVTFAPLQQQVYTDSLDITFDQPCSDIRVIPITGSGRLNVIVELILPKLTLDPRFEDYRIPITGRITNGTQDVNGGRLRVGIRYAAPVFAARSVSSGTITRNEVIGGIAFVDIDVPNVAVTQEMSTIVELIGDVTLGNIDSTDLTFGFTTLTSATAVPTVRSQNGHIVLEICEEGGPRLIEKIGGLQLRAGPNPAPQDMKIYTEVFEPGVHTLQVVDITGTVVSEWNWNHTRGDAPRTVVLPTQALAAGTYSIVLRTPTRSRVVSCTILH